MALPIHLFFDTSFLRGHPPRGVTIRVLRELARTGAVEIHVPWIVEHELKTQIAALLEPLPRQYRAAASWVADDERNLLTSAIDQINQFAQRADRLIEAGVDEWLTQLGAVRAKPSSVSSDNVFARYFAGELPFKKKKSREDIPDAFIGESIRVLASAHPDRVHVLMKDARFVEACRAISGVRIHEDILSIFQIPELAPKVSKAEILLFSRERQAELEALLESKLGEAVSGREVTSPEFPSDNNEATVCGFGSADDIQLDYDGLELIAKDAITIPVTCDLLGNTVDLFIFKSDYYCMDEDDTRFMVADSDWNDHYVRAQADVDLRVTCSVTVEVEKDANGNYHQFGDVEVSVEETEVIEIHGHTRSRKPVSQVRSP